LNAQITEDTCVKRRILASPEQGLSKPGPELSVNTHHLLYGRLPIAVYENVDALAEDTINCASVNVNVRAVEIAEGFLDSAQLRFEDRIRASLLPGPIQAHCQTEFEGHIEPRSQRRSPIKLDTGKIVNGIPAILNQRENSVEPSLAKWNFERGTWCKAERTYSSDIGKKEIFELRVIRNVQEHRFRSNGVLPMRSSSSASSFS
jgi:hypothetical protein